ncbi:DUF1801 domain-containing protein [Micromonospora sp. NPDC047548]|uniref:DUF1801 domain-containing protein n=1 Tax=Micromonospora sp. NPDC047548 TaxID=3155624 RepID=UPI0033D44834
MANLHPHRPQDVDRFMADLDHPLAAEVAALRAVILGVDDRITEQVKRKAPSFSCGDYLVTFNLRATQHVHLVFHNPHVARVASPLLAGDYPDRRMAYLTDLADVEAKRAELERVVRELIRLTCPT